MNHLRVIASRYGGPETLVATEEPLPEPKTGEARVRTEAMGVAFADLLVRQGLYPGGPMPPLTPGYDLIGVVDALGEGTRRPAIGTRVAALTVTGSYAEHVCVDARELVLIPRALDAAEAVCLVLNYVTAHQMLHRVARVRKDDSILVHGAAGGVGTALLHLGRLAGLTLYGTASGRKHERISTLGARLIDYRREDFVRQIAAATRGEGVRAVFDPVGGRNVQRSYTCLARGGRLVSYGVTGMTRRGRVRGYLAGAATFVRLGLLAALPDGKRALFYSILSYKRKHPDWFRDDLTRLCDLLTHRAIEPIVAARLPLTEAAHAHRMLEDGEVIGKVVLLPAGSRRPEGPPTAPTPWA
ncbi:MAG: medium chain dehydrogenase/reductase family protein [Candidatus Eisenbacteria bacterium]